MPASTHVVQRVADAVYELNHEHNEFERTSQTLDAQTRKRGMRKVIGKFRDKLKALASQLPRIRRIRQGKEQDDFDIAGPTLVFRDHPDKQNLFGILIKVMPEGLSGQYYNWNSKSFPEEMWGMNAGLPPRHHQATSVNVDVGGNQNSPIVLSSDSDDECKQCGNDGNDNLSKKKRRTPSSSATRSREKMIAIADAIISDINNPWFTTAQPFGFQQWWTKIKKLLRRGHNGTQPLPMPTELWYPETPQGARDLNAVWSALNKGRRTKATAYMGSDKESEAWRDFVNKAEPFAIPDEMPWYERYAKHSWPRYKRMRTK